MYYKGFTLSDVNVISLLLEYRYKYDENFYLQGDSCFDVTGASALNQELIAVFADLDSIIESIGLTPLQHQIIKLIHEGYTYDEIEQLTSAPKGRLRGRIQTICKAIKQENDRRWRKVTYVNTLGLKTKTCSMCKEHLPATNEFYTLDESQVDLCTSRCKRCRNIMARTGNVNKRSS